MTEAFRRDARMNSCAIHLFIDAWPSGWMKTIMDCERRPKPAYFGYRDALEPLSVSIRTDRRAFTSGEEMTFEFWVCNDTPGKPAGLRLRWQIELLFRLWKSKGHLSRIAGRRRERILCEIYAKLIVMLVFHYLTAPVRWAERKLSPVKALQTLQHHAKAFAQARLPTRCLTAKETRRKLRFMTEEDALCAKGFTAQPISAVLNAGT